jgi:hypothetical protein
MLGHGTPIHGKRTITKAVRVLALIGFCAVSWGAGTALVAAPALASTCIPLGVACPPDDFTGQAAGTLLEYVNTSFSSSGSLAGTETAAVYRDSGGTLDFYLQASLAATAASPITNVSVSDYQGATADMGYRSDGSAVAGGEFVDGSQSPSDVARGTTGDPVAWDFAGPSAVNTLAPGETSMVLEIKTNATDYTPGSVTFVAGSDTAIGGAYAPFVTPISSTANPSAADTGTKLQDSATLTAAGTPDGSGSITFNLYGPGDTTCSTPIHTETVSHVTNDGPWNTTTGYVAAAPGTYQWVASFSGDIGNPAGSTLCGDEPVVVTVSSQITSAATTCSQVAGGTSSTLFGAHYSVARGKINAVTPAKFSYWASLVSTGGTQTYSLDQFTNETSRQFHLATGSAVYTAGCSSVSALIGQSGGAVTVKFNGGTAGDMYLIGLKFSTSGLVGETAPKPSGTVRYLFKALASESEFDLVK